MSFDLEEILEEFAEAAGKGREWVDPKSHRIINLERLRAYKRRWIREWRRLNPEAARLKDRAKYLRVRADPARLAIRKETWTRQNARRRADPDRARRARESALRAYYRRKAKAVAR